MAPVAVIGQAVATAALPTLAALHAAGRDDELHATLERALRGTLTLAVMATAGVYVFAEPIVEVIYRRGAFDAAASERVAGLLAILALAIPGWVVQQVGIRAFFARAEMWRAMGLGTAVALCAIPLYLGLGERDGAQGLAKAGVVAITVNAVLTLLWARARYGGPALGPVLDTLLRSSVVGVMAGAAGSLGARSAALSGGAWFELVVGGIVFALVAGPGIALLGDPAMREAFARVGERLSGGRRGAGKEEGQGEGEGKGD
jgi:putative peptidoglycan lipid II flippase